MPNIKSAMKRVRVTERKTLRNKMIKTRVKSQIKRCEAAFDNKAEDAVKQFSLTTAEIDKAVSKGIMHKNTAARKKSRLAKRLAAISK